MHARQLGGDDLERPDDPAVPLRDEVADLVLGEVFEDALLATLPQVSRGSPPPNTGASG